MGKLTYAHAGVDLGRYGSLIKIIKRHLKRSSEAAGAGLFAGAIELKGGSRSGQMLLASVDGVGTKVKVATAVGRHSGIGQDIVAHCANDVLCLGARPIAFLDYIAFDKIDDLIFREVVSGIARECRKHHIQLIGGETAEMPGIYRAGEYDLVGFVLGIASKRNLIDGSGIRQGDLIVGLPSSGLHTNGYSLARKVLFGKGRMSVSYRPDGWRNPLGKVLLRPHRNYLSEVYPLVERRVLTGTVHVTGGGIAGNLTRILPSDCGAALRKSLWRVPDVFRLIADAGPVDEQEMFKVFNMGLGMLLVCPASSLPAVLKHTKGSRVVGEIVGGNGEVVIE
jgi:phosphoribosylformylglycinamidine cyclo-ligase